MSIQRDAMFAHAAEQMRRIRRCNPLRRKMASDVEISRIFSLLHHLMMLFGVANGVLLRADVVPETAIAHFIFSANFRDIFSIAESSSSAATSFSLAIREAPLLPS